uniref:Ring finger protein 17 n=1 Tax=Salvator merianae TaxID=96440 RepID=A0A8D0C177_SALMN
MGAFSVYQFRYSPKGNTLKLKNMKQELKRSSQTNEELEPHFEEIDTGSLPSEADKYLEESKLQFQGIVSPPSCKYGTAFSQTACSPDVIIEEIIENDPDSEYYYLMLGGLACNSPELVFVSSVVNPCHFYVRKASQKKVAVYIEKILKQFCANKKSSPNDVLELGSIIFVRSKIHGIWCRANIIELKSLKNTSKGKPCGPTKYKICDIAMMKVFLIDFGHLEALIISGTPNEIIGNPENFIVEYKGIQDLCLAVKKPDLCIEAQLRDLSKLALQCSLKDIVPKHPTEGWPRAAKTEFLRMVNSKAVLMKVFGEEDGVLIVDLVKPPANKISSDMPVSLREALVFLDLASYRTEFSHRRETTVPLKYIPPTIPQSNEEVAVVVSYINSPGDFYIQLVEQGPEFAAFLNKVEEVYRNDATAGLEIICPVQDQPCIAKFEDDGVWYRAQVIGLPGRQEVEVKYVDFGNTAKIRVEEMRKIKDEFLALPAKAIRCKLAYIEPCEGSNNWSTKSKNRFEELIQCKCMLCFVIEKSQEDVLSVELYEVAHGAPNVRWSVNSLLVKEGLAFYSSSVNMATRSCTEIWDPSQEEIFRTEGNYLKHDSEDLPQSEDLELDCSRELQVRISYVVSPSKIYVHLVSSEQTLKSLQEKMAVKYSESENAAVQWEVDMDCASFVCNLNQWQRGQIRRIVSEGIVEVFLFDLGITKIMDTLSLRELEQNLKTIKPLAIECSLTDIRPAGGTEEWTATACDVLANYLNGAVVNLIIQESNSSPLPVKIFSRDGELYNDVSEYMIKQGLPLEMPSPDSSQDNLDRSCSPAETPGSSVVEKDADSVITDGEDQELTHPIAIEAYKPPAVPTSVCFSAVVSCVTDSGTIYMLPKSQEEQLNKLMNDIQTNFKYLGLLEPYNWKKGEACVVRVQYLDYGYIEKIPQCHLYPTVLYAEIPPFSIPCQLYKTVPLGNVWQQDAVELLQDLLTKRLVEIRVMEQPDNPWGKVSIMLQFSRISLSSFLAYHKHCVTEEQDDPMPKLILNLNNVVYFVDMPCLAQYSDGCWYRAKLLSIHEFCPVLIVVEFVDYGSCETLPTSRLRQLPAEFMQYPTRAFRVLLAGFKPASNYSASRKIPYCPEWSMEALWAMTDLFQGKSLCASSLTRSPNHTVFLYENGHLVHMKLVEMGYAELS